MAELERTVQQLSAEGQLSADAPNMGPADVGFAVDDDTSCKGSCGRMGWCQNNQVRGRLGVFQTLQKFVLGGLCVCVCACVCVCVCVYLRRQEKHTRVQLLSALLRASIGFDQRERSEFSQCMCVHERRQGKHSRTSFGLPACKAPGVLPTRAK